MDYQELIKEVTSNKMFIGRKKYCELLVKTYREVYNSGVRNVPQTREPRILSFDGRGGIGKTRLMEYLCAFLDKNKYSGSDIINVDTTTKLPFEQLPHVSIELAEYSDKVTILDDLHNRINKFYGGEHFPIYNKAHEQYTGYRPMLDNSKQTVITDAMHLTKEVACEITGDIPVVGTVFKALKILIDNGVPLFKDTVDAIASVEQKDLINLIEQMSHSLLYRSMHLFFIYDMCQLMSKQGLPLVIFLDNYEAYHGGVLSNNFFDDKWLREDIKAMDALMQRIPNVLWVVLGREPLTWNSITRNDTLIELKTPDNIITETPEETNSISEAEEYLYTALGITKGDDSTTTELITALANRSQGLPLTLDLYIDTYKNTPIENLSLNSFAIEYETLHKRYFRYLDNNISFRDGVIFLACIGEWNDEEAKIVGRDFMYNPYRWSKTYDEIKNISFIKKLNYQSTDEAVYRYKFYDDEIRDMFRKEAGDEMVSEANWRLLQLRLNKFDVNAEYDKFAADINDIVNALIGIQYIYPSQTDFEPVFFSVIDYINALNEKGLFKTALALASKLTKHFENSCFRDTIFEAWSKFQCAEELRSIGDYEDALAAIQPAQNIISQLLEKDAENATYTEKQRLIEFAYVDYSCMTGHYTEAKNTIETLIKNTENTVYQSNDLEFILLKNEYARTLSLLGDLDDAVSLHLELLDAIDTCTDENAALMKAIIQSETSSNYLSLGDATTALTYAQKAYEKNATISNLEQLTNCYVALGTYDNIIDNRQKIYNHYSSLLGLTHSKTLESLTDLASAYRLNNNLEQALIHQQEVYNLYKANEKNDITTLNCYYLLGQIIFDLGRTPTNTDTIRDILQKHHELSTNEITASFCYKRAYKIACDVCDILEAQSNSDIILIYAQILKGRSLVELTDHPDRNAAPLIIKAALKKLSDLRGEKHFDTLFYLIRLAEAYADIGDTENAHKTFEKHIELLGENNPATMESMLNSAIFIINPMRNSGKSGNLALALRRAKRAYEYSQKPTISNDEKARYANTYAWTLYYTKQPREAIKKATEACNLLGKNHSLYAEYAEDRTKMQKPIRHK